MFDPEDIVADSGPLVDTYSFHLEMCRSHRMTNFEHPDTLPCHHGVLIHCSACVEVEVEAGVVIVKGGEIADFDADVADAVAESHTVVNRDGRG